MSTAQSLSEWFASPQGRYVLPFEQAHFDRTVNDIFGYNALQLGLSEHDFLRNSRIPHRFTGADRKADVRLCGVELPFACNSLDMVLMPHVLDFAANPHQILREVERVLRPEGSVLISGFNPLSLWGLHRALGRRHGYPWCGHFIAVSRLKDWLALLGFEVEAVRFVAYAPPFRQHKWLERSNFMESAGRRWWPAVGGVYFVHAIKRVPGLRLLKPQWKQGLVNSLLPVAPKLNKPVSQCVDSRLVNNEQNGQNLKHE
ncbi:MAG: class I SAM-dependent methyltransferase [Gallionella sp.]|nr:class I SAM-dependent methyltransferase [Gallionella sp.]MDD4946504.1 class I SAM-dependent methyltransferase [Gallionella sp.]MDD5612300.1 class I SAM-dependent methyltransferase [Gallionella sp.]